MIHIEQHQDVFDRPDLKVVVPTGEYNEADLLPCAPADDLGNPICMFQAQLIAFGNVVYQQDEVLSDSQVSALLSGDAPEDVIGNEDLIDDTTPISAARTVEVSAPTTQEASPSSNTPAPVVTEPGPAIIPAADSVPTDSVPVEPAPLEPEPVVVPIEAPAEESSGEVSIVPAKRRMRVASRKRSVA